MRIFVLLLTLARGQCPHGCICDEHDKTAQCHAVNAEEKFTAVPDGFPWFIQEVILTDNLLKSIPADAFPKRSNIQNFNFRRNQIVNIHESAFVSQTKLQYLTLSSNQLQRIPTKPLNTLKLLKELFLDSNNITAIKQKSFEKMENLEWLHLANNKIETIAGDAFVGLQRIKFLNLEGNRIQAIGQNTLAHLSGCVILDLSQNYIKRVHEKGFLFLVHLNQLKLDSNLLGDSSLPPGLFARMGKLEVLSLANNTLVGIPEADTWSGLKKLEALHLTSNKLALIQANNFKHLKTLKRLFLDDNKIVTIEEGAFVELDHLSIIDMSDNQLDKVLHNRFMPLGALTVLDLRNNRMKMVEPGSFATNIQLNKVDLGQNKLTELDPHLFEHCTKLETLALDHNQLTVTLMEWQKYGQKVHLTLSHNLWSCDCHMLKFINAVLNEVYGAKIDGSLREMICAEPPNLKGHPVTDIEEDHMHCWAIEDFIWDAGVIVWLIALLAVIKKRRIVQSIFWCCFGANDDELKRSA